MKGWKGAVWGWLGVIPLLLVLPGKLGAQAAPASWPPLAKGERLVYKLLWPSGLPLGEAVLNASRAGQEVRFSLTVDADLPQHHASYSFSSTATDELCSRRFRQRSQEGRRSWEESVEFDQERHEARYTRGAQVSTVSVPECARDPLTLLYFFRRQIAFQEVPRGQPHQGVFTLGADFSVNFEVGAAEPVQKKSPAWEGDRYLISYVGPAGRNSFEVWIRPDLSRQPVAIQVTFPLATYTAELQ